VNPGAPGGIDGDPATVAIIYASRDIFIGLALLSLAIVDWARIGKFFAEARGSSESQSPGDSTNERSLG